MDNTARPFDFIDNGGRRMFSDRRRYTYTYHMPERRKSCQDEPKDNQITVSEYPFTEKRSIKDRRSGSDRRIELRYQVQQERR
ncbi:MAG: hypothetical protein ABIK15_15695 [Pseudomonadota bacterium]